MRSARACSSRTRTRRRASGFPARGTGGATDEAGTFSGDHRIVSSYAVLWSEPRQDVETGKLELEPTGLRFEGSHGRRPARVHRLGYGEIERVRIGHQVQERLRGRPSVVLDLAAGGGPLRIGLVDAPGVRSELADELTRLSAKTG
jgi:hypothetical protein